MLLSISYLLPQMWFILLFALIPFLWRLHRIGPAMSLLLGAMAAASFLFATAFNELISQPIPFLGQLVLVIVAFAAFGLVINKTGKWLGYNPFSIALLWLPIQYFLIQYSNFRPLLAHSSLESPVLTELCSLLGVLAASTVVLLANACVLILITHVIRKIMPRHRSIPANDRLPYASVDQGTLEPAPHSFVDVRAPPRSAVVYREAG